MATTTTADQQPLVAEDAQAKSAVPSTTTSASLDTKESSSGAAKEASPLKEAIKDTKMRSGNEQEIAKPSGGDKSKEKSKSPAKDLPAASSGSSPEKDSAKSTTGADIKTTDKDAKSASTDKAKAISEVTEGEAAKGTGIVQTTVDAMKNFVEKVVDKVQDVYSHTVHSDTVPAEGKGDDEKKATQKEKSPGKTIEKKDDKSSNKPDNKSKKSQSPADKKKAATVQTSSTQKVASSSNDQPAQSGIDVIETNSKDVEMTDASKEANSEQTAKEVESSSDNTTVKVGRGRRGSSGPRKAKEEIETPPESLRRSSRLSKTADSDAKNGASGKKRGASPTDTKSTKKATPAAVAAPASNGSAGKNSRRK